MESVLFVSPYRPGDRPFGSDSRTRSVLRWLSEAGLNVHFVYLTRKFFERPPSFELRRWIASYHTLHVAGCESSSPQPLGWQCLTRSRSSTLQQHWSQRRRSGQPLHVCLEKLLESTQATMLWINHTAYAPVVDNLPVNKNVTRILDTHDILHLRDASLSSAGVLPEQGITRDQEQELLSHFDLLVAIQDRERETLQRLLPKQKVVTVGHTLEIRPQASTSADICFVGSQYVVNEVGLLRFLQDAWPGIRQRCPHTRLQVVGGVSKCPSIMAVARYDKRILLRGVVDQVDDIYAGPAVVICPMSCGSGLSIKLAEALAHGKATVASPLAAEGLNDGAGKTFLVADEPCDFVDQVSSLLQNHERREQLEKEAAVYATSNFSALRVWSEFSEFLDSRRASRRLVQVA